MDSCFRRNDRKGCRNDRKDVKILSLKRGRESIKNIIRRSSWVVLDIVFVNISLFFSLILRFGKDWGIYFCIYRESIIYLTACFLLFAIIFKLYKTIWRYLSISDLFLIAKVVTAGIFVAILCLILVKGIVFPRTVAVLTWFFSLALVSGSRLTWRLYCERKSSFSNGMGQERILIVGAGDAGEIISREIIKKSDLGKLVGFVDDDKEKIGKRIHNIKVLGNVEEINDILEKELVSTVIIAIPTASGKQIRRIVDNIKNKEIKIKTLPGLYELVDGKVSFSRIRNVSIEDLLGREQVNLDLEEISEYLEDKRVLITGAAGSIGSELVKQIINFSPKELVAVDIDETRLFSLEKAIKDKNPDAPLTKFLGDITDKEKMESLFSSFSPQIVFHAAAYKHVPMMEEFPEEAVKVNIMGTNLLTNLALKYDVERFVFISTDKAVNPTSVMGTTKRVEEIMLTQSNRNGNTKFIAVRFGNVLGSRGSLIPIIKEQIKKYGPITITHPEMKRYFMDISEAVSLVVQAGIMGKGGEIFVLDMGEPVYIYDIAKEMIRIYGFEIDKDIPIVFTGVRPGEKMCEELFYSYENIEKTEHPKISKACLKITMDFNHLNDQLMNLEELTKSRNKAEIIRFLQDIVPEYKPNKKREK